MNFKIEPSLTKKYIEMGDLTRGLIYLGQHHTCLLVCYHSYNTLNIDC